MNNNNLNNWADYYAAKQLFETKFGFVTAWATPSRHPFVIWSKQHNTVNAAMAKDHLMGLRK